jgi:ABC-type sugar transport system substrate-binding protein
VAAAARGLEVADATEAAEVLEEAPAEGVPVVTVDVEAREVDPGART